MPASGVQSRHRSRPMQLGGPVPRVRMPLELLGGPLVALFLAGCGGGTTDPAPPGNEPPTIVAAGGGGQTGQAGAPLAEPVAVLVRNADGNPIQGMSVSWGTSGGSFSAPTTTTDADGNAAATWTLGSAAGSQSATASLAGATGSPVTFTATAVAPASLTITGVSPSPIVEGQSATISGSGFGTSVAGLAVTVDGAAATILQVTPTTILVTVPVSDCKPARTGDIGVTLNSLQSNALPAPLGPASFVSVPVGQEVVLQDPASFCLQFGASPGNADYLIGVQSTSEVVSNLTPITLAATAAGAGVPPLPSLSVHAGPAGAVRSGPGASLTQQDRARRWERHRSAEARIRRAERALVGRAKLVGTGSASNFSRATATVSFQVGDTVTGSVPDVPNNALCNPIPVTAVVRAVGTRGIWLEDVDNPTGGYSPTDFDALSTQLDNLIYPTDVAYFGDPTDLDDTGRIFVLITKEVNRTPSLLGFVFGGDLISRASCASSNEGEIFYGIAPDPTGIYPGGAYPVEQARADAPFLIAHEFTHIIQQSRRLYVAQGPFMASWTAEGQATLAEEVVGFAAEGHAVGQNLGFAVALNEDDPASIDWYSNKIFDLAIYYGLQSTPGKVPGAPSECSWLDKAPANTGPCIPGREIYGVPWSLLRWLSDQYGAGFPGGEQGLQQALINSTAVGYDNIASVVGVPIKTLLARWAAALYVDDRIPGASAALTIPTWDLYDIFEVNAGPAARLTPVSQGFGSFTETAKVRAASTAYYRISGVNSPATSVRIRGAGGATLPSHMQVFVVRVR